MFFMDAQHLQMIKKNLLSVCKRENLERLAKWLNLTIDPNCSDSDLIEKIHLEIMYS